MLNSSLEPPMKKALPDATVFVLQETDEMRHPYETALKALGSQIVWFHSITALLEGAARSEPMALVVDLECLRQPVEPEIENLRAQFPSTELVALSASDTSQLALQCIRSGFGDFLLKPTSPEELAYSIRKARQRREFISKIQDPRARVVRAITQITGCTTPTLVRLFTLESLLHSVGAKGAAWLSLDKKGPEFTKVLCSVPKRTPISKIVFDLPFEKINFEEGRPIVMKNRTAETRKLLLPCRDFPQGAIFIWGIIPKVTAKVISAATILTDQAEMSLLNIHKFEEVKQQTFVDDLTGLFNLRYLKYALTNSILRCKEPEQKFSVLFIDVDHFKKVNDRHSHLVGSEFLVTIGKTIKNSVRRIDPVFRYGGDEFVVILNDTPTEGAKEIAERIRKNIERRLFVVKEQRIQTTVSIGLATYPEHAADMETLLRLADEAMYCAKRETRNAVHIAFPLEKRQAQQGR